MKITRLRGWRASVEKSFPGNGNEPVWKLVFTEMHPATGDQISFEMDQKTRDGLVQGLTDGIVLAGGDLPQL